MHSTLLADVALRAGVADAAHAVLSYRVPPRLHGLIRPGQLVWVPLRARQVQGVVIDLYELPPAGPPPPAPLRDLADLGDPEAILTSAGLRLARWVARRYLAPLAETLGLLLPPGSSQQSEVTWRVTPAGHTADLGGLPEDERAVLYHLRRSGESSERDLRRVLRGDDAQLRTIYAALYERGYLARGAVRSAPAARPRRIRTVRRTVTDAALEATLAALERRAPRQAAALRALAETDLPVTDVYQASPGVNLATLRALEQAGLAVLDDREVRRDPLSGDGIPPDIPPQLTARQRDVWEQISMALDAAFAGTDPAPQPILLHGITGSGKTEIYLRAMARAIRAGRQALVLVPEIALTAQLVRRFAARFPGQLAVLHSGLSIGERYDEWRRLRRGEARIAIGSRSAAFAPLPELGLVIVDEEHEPSYKSDHHPRYHARDVAVELARLTGSICILGSATPSVESYHLARSGSYWLLELPERVGGRNQDGSPAAALPLPTIRVVDMRTELAAGNRSIFSRLLQATLAETLARGDQAILFLNRRGAAASVICRDCGQAVTCPACSIPLVVHLEAPPTRDQDQPAVTGTAPAAALLICHSCNYRQYIPVACPACMSPRIRSFGAGTQRVVDEVATLFPQARTLRWDRDTAVGKDAHTRMLTRFLRHEADVLVGTQMIAKGLDLPLVALVGVVAADTGLHLPDFRAGERSFQLLTQVAGRAGRRRAGAQVVVQTYSPDHYAVRAAAEQDYQAFARDELAFRRQAGYPPFARLARFVYAAGSDAAARRTAEQLAGRLRQAAAASGAASWSLAGPAPAFHHRQRSRWRWHLVLRTPELEAVLACLQPGDLRGWMVDVDPAYVL